MASPSNNGRHLTTPGGKCKPPVVVVVRWARRCLNRPPNRSGTLPTSIRALAASGGAFAGIGARGAVTGQARHLERATTR